MALKKKILLGYGVAFALMWVVIGWAVENLISLGKASDAILRENYRSILAAENMVDALERQDSGILLKLLGEDRMGTAQFRENEAVFLQWLARAKDNVTVAGEADLVRSIDEGYSKFRVQFFAPTDRHDGEGSLGTADKNRYQQIVYPLFDKVRNACIQLRNLNEDTMYAASVRAGRVAGRAIWSTVLVAASAVIVALVFSLFLSERIVRPLRSFMEASRKIAAGDYTVQVPVETGDELGRLAGEFNEMTTRLARYHEMNIEQVISEKQKGEAILSSIEDGLVVFDTDLKASGINPAARRMLGLESGYCTAPYCTDILPEARICDLIRKTIETGVPPAGSDDEWIVTLTEGDHQHHYLFSVTPIRGKERRLLGIVLVLRDVTRLKEVERLKSEFVMAASHELGTPLTSIGMSVDLLRQHAAGALEEKDRELLEAAHEEVHRLKALVNDLLNLSRIEAGRIEMEFEKISLKTVLEHVREVFKGQMERKSVELSVQPADDLPGIRADGNKLTWVLTNLISNALRYVKEGGHIRIQAHRIGEYVHLAVRDDGPGIPSEYQTRIFQKFVQLKGRDAGGTGLGLAICKEIVRAHGGTIWVESRPGEGSCFIFTLPVAS